MKVKEDYQLEGQITIFDILSLDTWSGKMSQEYLVPEIQKEQISRLSSKKSSKSSAKNVPIFLYLGGGGDTQAASKEWVIMESPLALHGDCTMLNTGESPNEERESHLSQILEDNPHPKYSLSAKACMGILIRAKKRGKILPPMLEKTLRMQSKENPSVFSSEQDARGGGKGILIQYEKTGTLSTLNNQSVFCIDTSHADDVCPALQERDYKGGKNVFAQDAYDKYTENDKSATLKSCGGSCGGGSEALIVEGFDGYNQCLTGEIAKTLTSGRNDSHNILSVCVPENHPHDSRTKIFDARGNGDGKISCTITGDHQSRVTDYTAIALSTVVRRLTPMECERLQGFPDGWTDIGEWIDSKGKKRKSTDSARYKALGNSIAVGYANGKTGFWCWMADRMVDQLRHSGVENPTMASLFDGIGGFPLAFDSCGCKPVWASEIEEFPIAITKKRFPEE